MNSLPGGLDQFDDNAPEPDADPEPDPDPESESSPAARAEAGGDGKDRPPASPGQRIATAGVALVLAVGLVAGLWSVPSVRTVLLQSFTRQQAPFTELYFTDTPRFDGGTLIVHVAVNAHGTGAAPLRLKMTLESRGGKVLNTRTVGLKPKDGKAVPVVARFPKTSDTARVRVALVGHAQSLHYTFVAPRNPSGTS